MRTENNRRANPRRWLWRLSLLLLVLIWFSGLAGRALRATAARWLVPRQYGDIAVSGIGYFPHPLDTADLTLLIGRERLRLLLRDALGWRRHLLPPGLMVDGLTVHGVWLPRFGQGTGDDDFFPQHWAIHIEPDAAWPQLSWRLSPEAFNAWLDLEEDLTNHTATGSYPLGSYRLDYQLLFDSLRIRSVPDDSLVNRPVVHRRLRGEATGRINGRFRSRLIRMRSRADVSSLRMSADVQFLRYQDGISVVYNLRIRELEANFRGLPPFIDRRVAEQVREALQRSFNRTRTKDRLERRRLPVWLPTDLEIDIWVDPDGLFLD